MEIKLSRRRTPATVALGILVLVTFVLFFGLFLTISARAKKFRPRQLPPEETNAVNHIQVEWLSSLPPLHQDNPTASAVTTKAAKTPDSFTGEIMFPWCPELEGWLYLWRTPDFYNYTLLHYVMFEEEDRFITNSAGKIFIVVRFVDLYAPEGNFFYDGYIRTNSQPGLY